MPRDGVYIVHVRSFQGSYVFVVFTQNKTNHGIPELVSVVSNVSPYAGTSSPPRAMIQGYLSPPLSTALFRVEKRTGAVHARELDIIFHGSIEFSSNYVALQGGTQTAIHV